MGGVWARASRANSSETRQSTENAVRESKLLNPRWSSLVLSLCHCKMRFRQRLIARCAAATLLWSSASVLGACGRTGLLAEGDLVDDPVDIVELPEASVEAAMDAGPDAAIERAVETPPPVVGPTTGACQPAPEACNGVDDDCNGKVDDLLRARPVPGRWLSLLRRRSMERVPRAMRRLLARQPTRLLHLVLPLLGRADVRRRRQGLRLVPRAKATRRMRRSRAQAQQFAPARAVLSRQRLLLRRPARHRQRRRSLRVPRALRRGPVPSVKIVCARWWPSFLSRQARRAQRRAAGLTSSRRSPKTARPVCRPTPSSPLDTLVR